jgi:hypothetical protein
MSADVEPPSTTVKGKLCYMSPEQARGQLLDGRSDMFAVGVMFYELLCGRRPFDGNSDAETLLRVTSGQFTPLRQVAPEVPPGLAHVVERLIHRDREQRYASADDCIDALTAFSPRLTSFRELGNMAKAARPHETLAGVDIEALEALDHAVNALPLPSTLLETQALPGNTLPPRAAPPQLHHEPYVAPVTRSQTTLPAVHRNAWIALGVSFTLLLVVGFAWATRLSQQRQENSALAALNAVRPAEVQRFEPPVVPAQPSAMQYGQAAQPSQGAGTSNIELIPLAGANDPPPAQPLRAEPAALPARSPRASSSGSRAESRAERPDATLDVGVVPWGKIWIDNRLYGWTPLRGIKLHPGRHLIGAGVDSSQQVRKHINLKPGEQAVLTLQLDGSGGGDEATGSHNDR